MFGSFKRKIKRCNAGQTIIGNSAEAIESIGFFLMTNMENQKPVNIIIIIIHADWWY